MYDPPLVYCKSLAIRTLSHNYNMFWYARILRYVIYYCVQSIHFMFLIMIHDTKSRVLPKSRKSGNFLWYFLQDGDNEAYDIYRSLIPTLGVRYVLIDIQSVSLALYSSSMLSPKLALCEMDKACLMENNPNLITELSGMWDKSRKCRMMKMSAAFTQFTRQSSVNAGSWSDKVIALKPCDGSIPMQYDVQFCQIPNPLSVNPCIANGECNTVGYKKLPYTILLAY